MKHHVCPICGGVSDHPKVCETPGCTHASHDLVECNCMSGVHEGVLQVCKDCGTLCKGSCAVEPYKEELSA